jgi:hypothetical protein
MYWVRGLDGREYGPADTEHVRQWLSEGRISADTLARAEGSAEWKPLRDYPDFAASGMHSGEPPPIRIAEEPQRARGPDIGACLRRGWELVKNNIGGSLLAVVILIAFQLPPGIVLGIFSAITGVKGFGFEIFQSAVSFVWAILVVAPVTGGIYLYFIRRSRGESADLTSVLSASARAYGQLVLGSLVSSVLILIGLAFCLIPGIYLIVAWVFALPLIIDKRLDFWSALELSRKTITPYWWIYFVLLILAVLIGIAGFLACFVGAFVTLAITVATMTWAYRDAID